jgi:hypothetical protein
MWPEHLEITIPVDPLQYALYRDGDPRCLYHAVRWERQRGRSRKGEFPVVVARKYFRDRGYTVWAAEPELPNGDGFILMAYPGKRRRGHPAYKRMESVFGADVLHALNESADVVKRMHTANAGGGDPDLFVFKGVERFFVEVKWRDHITKKQRLTFPLIEKYCKVPVRVVRIREVSS